MIPIKDNIKSRSFPLMTILFIILNTLIFYFQATLPPGEIQHFVWTFGFIPKSLTIAEQLDIALINLVTSMFLHGGLLHLIGNMLYLWIFGDNIEDRLGKLGFILFYIFAGVSGNIAHFIFNPASDVPLIGASGAVAGILGMYFVLFPQARILTIVPIGFFITAVHLPALIFLGLWFLLQGLNAFIVIPDSVNTVAWWAHIGGFITGMVWGIIIRK